MDNPLWSYSCAMYAREGVAPACLQLQDQFSVDVNVLLYGAWLASMDQLLSEQHLAGLEAVVAPWRTRVVQPLRVQRQQLRGYDQAEGLREQIKALELQAERQQQDLMRGYHSNTEPLIVASATLGDNLALVARFSCPNDDRRTSVIEHLKALLAG